jgi:hypothetical protein
MRSWAAQALLTWTGPVRVSVPRDREASFPPAIVPKRARRLSGVDDLVMSRETAGCGVGADRRPALSYLHLVILSLDPTGLRGQR